MSYETEGQWPRKRGRLEKAYALPLTHYVQRLRQEHGHDNVPDFDPEDGGVSAKILLLLTSPSPHALPHSGSGFVSMENHDSTAQAVNKAVHSLLIGRMSFVLWNLVPWRTPSEKPTGNEVAAGLKELGELMKLLPNVQVVIATGTSASSVAEQIRPLIGERHLMTCASPRPRGKTKEASISALVQTLKQAEATLS
ncbi:hypothetical protein GCM10008955_35040 [Deinococcus malanensis]|uniref:Uracil-DNA glycosylase-like domain-containing protein n=1 Tax=Deinococcus malanensis TaxID=1706855 RepID=A0ABQ2F3J1_9DEIO|nr:hypothetical protein [Deinococcus malanensis]GGK38135.1 hypothetical protein GCM10008955_35040 [Deinococcus malanensis]